MAKLPGLLLVALAAAIPAVASSEVVSDCSNDTELRADLTAMQAGAGGTLTFACNPATIVLTADLPQITKPTVIDGGNDITISGGNSRRIFFVGDGATLTVKSIVLTNASASGDGGAIYSDGSLVLEDTIIRDSTATLSGGALVSYGPVQIEDSEIASNEAAGGGAVYARFQAAPVTIERSWIHDNDGGLTGGAVFLWDGADATIRDSELSGNNARNGGAVFSAFSNSSVTIERSRLHDNTSIDQGGAIGVTGPLVLLDSEIHDNDCIDGVGAGLSYKGSSADIRQTTFHGNEAVTFGGAIYLEQASGVSLTNVTLSGNEGFQGGGIFWHLSSGVLSQTTIASNTGANGGGGLYLSSGSVLVTNSLFSDNVGDNCTIAGGTLSSSDGNVSSDPSCSAVLDKTHDENEASTMLGPLGRNGGLTPTHIPGPGSDAVDAALTVNAPLRDQRGVTRTQGVAADAGAVEVAACPALVLCGDANRNESVSAADALRALQFSVGSASSCPSWVCDYNGSGTVTSADALAILRSAVGAPSLPACPDPWDCHTLD